MNIDPASYKDWWKGTFDEKYLRTYVDMVSPKHTEREVDFLMRELDFKEDASILDVPCGHGRHSLSLSEQGYSVVGVDQSSVFIKKAQKEAERKELSVKFIEADMREISFHEQFDVAINMFTSIGYTNSSEDDVTFFENVCSALKPKGKFVVDVNNIYKRIQELFVLPNKQFQRANEPMYITTSEGITVTIYDFFDPLTSVWHEKSIWREGGVEKSHEGHVRLYTPAELGSMLKRAGFDIIRVCGDYTGKDFQFESPRSIMICQKR